jgi:drug/metabolite transporter (DMT)-like permease
VIRGILMMCIASVFFSAMHVTVRYISRDLPPMQIAFLRNIFGVIVFLPLLYLRGFAFLRTGRLGLYVVRGLVDAGAMLMFFTGLALVFGSWLCGNAALFRPGGVGIAAAISGGCGPVFRISGVWAVLAG